MTASVTTCLSLLSLAVSSLLLSHHVDARTANCLLESDVNLKNHVSGTVKFTQACAEDHIHIQVDIKGLPHAVDGDDKRHGFHVHQFGTINKGCINSGGHYNPDGKTHGAPHDDERHAGDFGNLVQNNDGTIKKDFTDTEASLFGDNSIAGRAIVLHAHADDLGRGGNAASLTNGNAGARLACCIIYITSDE